MSIGLEEAARRSGRSLEVALAVDNDPDIIGIYKTNFPAANVIAGDISSIFDGEIGRCPTPPEQEVKETAGEIDILLGGPPCQGHSDLNNHTRRKDPKNALYLRMARAAEVLGPKLVVIENVAPVQWDKTQVVEITTEALRQAGYKVAGGVVNLLRIGVPQRRRRFVLIASRTGQVDPAALLVHLMKGIPGHPNRTVLWAISDLMGMDKDTIFDTPSQMSKENQRRVAYLFDNDLHDLPNEERPTCHRDNEHSYVSMYGRLKWDEPAQTITTGFGSMGQGRYVHPQLRRTITPHEAARLQTFPDWFEFGARTPRGVLAKAIGNAVPPLLLVELGNLVMPIL